MGLRVQTAGGRIGKLRRQCIPETNSSSPYVVDSISVQVRHTTFMKRHLTCHFCIADIECSACLMTASSALLEGNILVLYS